MCFFPTDTTEGQVLCELIQKNLTKLRFDLAKVVGFCFDGAENMSGIHRNTAVLSLRCLMYMVNKKINTKFNKSIKSSLNENINDI